MQTLEYNKQTAKITPNTYDEGLASSDNPHIMKKCVYFGII